MWDFKNADFNVYRQVLNDTDWDECFIDENDIDNIVKLWTAKLLAAAESSIKNKDVCIRPNDKPWYNSYLRRLCRKKNNFHNNAKHSNTYQDWLKFTTIRNLYFSEVKRLKTEFDQQKYQALAMNKKSSKKWWSLIKKVQNSNDNFEVIPPIETNSDILTRDKDKAEAFNVFFSKASELDDSNAQLPNITRVLEINNLNSLIISKEDIVDQLKALDTTKAYGPDGVSPIFLKEGNDSLVNSLHRIFNLSLRLAKIPKLWKQANVVPIHKKELRSKMDNYRPVSLLSVVGKILERIIFKYVFNFFRDNFVITLFQSGFLPGHSTVTQLLEVYNELCKAVDKGREVRVIFLDISKAFDRVWHKGLIFKLQQSGISGQLLSWFIDYLQDRFQRVVVNGQQSEWKEIKAGVPQGSVLGPTLFLIFINDIVYVIRHCKIRMFADDTCLIIEVDNRESTAEHINEDLESVDAWSKQWLVNFSPAKTKSLIVSTKQDSHRNPQIHFGGQIIDEVKSHTYLGVKLASNLRWNHHINDISLKARKKLNAMVPFKYKLDRKSLETMYLSFVRPTMEYAQVVWGGTYDSDMVKLERIQVDAMRLITGATARSNIAKLYSETNFQTFESRTNDAMLCMMYKIVHRSAPPYLTNILELNDANPRYSMRNRDAIKIPHCRLSLFQRSFFPYTIKLWNKLPVNTQNIPTYESFKNHLRNKLDPANELYYYGERWPSVHHARMRIGCSKLNSDLFYNLHVINNPTCQCGALAENPYHYFFECANYQDQRDSLFQSISDINDIQLNTLLFGNPELSLVQNQTIFEAVHKFINSTKRFD